MKMHGGGPSLSPDLNLIMILCINQRPQTWMKWSKAVKKLCQNCSTTMWDNDKVTVFTWCMIIHWKLLKALNISILNPSPCRRTDSSFNSLNCSLKQSFLFCSGNPLRERWPHKPGLAAGGDLVLLSSPRLQRRAGTIAGMFEEPTACGNFLFKGTKLYYRNKYSAILLETVYFYTPYTCLKRHPFTLTR